MALLLSRIVVSGPNVDILYFDFLVMDADPLERGAKEGESPVPSSGKSSEGVTAFHR